MTGIIQLLPDHIANQIAAGEVIQRPASVVKELLENAIDAGATKIDLIVKDAGRTLIQVTDNGKGMSAMDALMCFERHATSKLHHADDLFKLTTKGFRGEALASIAAIAHVTLKTKMEDQDTGTLVQMEGSEILKEEPVVCATGTTLEVKNLFYNVPARRNFLKSDNVEFKNILNEFERVAIPHSDIQFQLIHNGEVVRKLTPGNLRQRLVELLGKNFNDKLVPIEESTTIVGLSGFIIKPEACKKSRGDQYFFVNNRFFKDSYFHSAISKAYESVIQPGHQPGYFLFLETDCEKIDVNVHPTKTEIKFEEDRHIFSILLTACKNSLGKFNIMPTLDFEAETSFEVPAALKKQPAQEPQIRVNHEYNPFHNESIRTSSKSNMGKTVSSNASLNAIGFGNSGSEDWSDFYPIEEESEEEPAAPQELDLDIEIERKPTLLAGNYIFTPLKDGLMSIHARRAMERVIYDEMMEQFIVSPIPSQGLLFPYEHKIDLHLMDLWQSHQRMLNQIGIRYEMADEMVQITSIPSVLQDENVDQFLAELDLQLSNNEIEKGELAHACILSVARASSNKKNLVKDTEGAHQIIEQLFRCAEHQYSPSGRPILKKISFEQIEKLN